MEFLEPNAERIWMPRRRFALDVWVGWIATLQDLDQCKSFKTSIFATGGRYPLTDVGCKPQVRNNVMSLQKSSSLDFYSLQMDSKKEICKSAKAPTISCNTGELKNRKRQIF